MENESKPSRVTIEFPDVGVTDRCSVNIENVTPAQFGAATFQMMGMAMYDVFLALQKSAAGQLVPQDQVQMAVRKVMESKVN